MTKTISTSRPTFWLLALGAALLLSFAATATAARAGHGDDPVAHNAGDDRGVRAPAGILQPAAGSDDPAGHDANDDRTAQAGATSASDDPAGHDAADDRVAQPVTVAPTVKKSIHKRADDRSARHDRAGKGKHHGESGAHA